MDKVVATAVEAVADVPDGASLAVGGFGLSGVPNVLIQALYERGVGGLSVVSDNCGAMDSGLAVLLAAGRIKAARAQQAGLFDAELAPVTIPQRKGDPVVLAADESVRPDTSLEAMAKLKPSFRKASEARRGSPRPEAGAGTVTAGNASPLNDGAAALLLTDAEGLEATGREPLARISATGVFAIGPPASALLPSKRSTAPWPRPAVPSRTWTSSNSTRPSPPRCSAAWPSGPSSTRRSSTRRAARSPWATPSAPPAPGSPAPSPTSSPARAPEPASPPSASVSGKASPSSSNAKEASGTP